jgi:hypothetical protein
MSRSRKQGRCHLSPFERRLYCFRKQANSDCIEPSFLGHRCPYLEMSKLELMETVKTERKVITSRGGFSREAIEYAERYRPQLRLKHGDKVVKPMRVKAVS